MKNKARKLLLILLSAMMFITSSPSAVFALGSKAAIIVETEVKYDTVQEAIDAATNGQTIKMLEDSEDNLTIADGKEITLDLNGCVLKSAANGKPVITIGETDSSTAKLTLIDSDSTATHSGNYADLPTGGVITGSVNNVTSGGGVRNKGTFTMNGGTIYGNKTDGGTYTGAGVYNQGTFTMNGGCISNNTAEKGNGAGVANQGTSFGASFTMNGGKIINNVTGTDGDTSGSGGGIYNESTLEITGGEISGNVAHCFGGGIEYSDGSVTIGGTAIVKNNTSGKNAESMKADNLYIYEGHYVAVATGDKAPVEDKMEIGVTLQSTTGCVTTSCVVDYQNYFHSDNTLYGVYNQTEDSGNYVYIGNRVKMFKTGDDPSTGTIYDNVNSALSAAENNFTYSSVTIQMLTDCTENLDLNSPAYSVTTDVTLDLNGHILKSESEGKNVITIGEGYTLTIIDNNATAIHDGDNANLPAGGIITGAAAITTGMLLAQKEAAGIVNNGTLNMLGGTVTANQGKTYAGVYNIGTMTVGGTAVIEGNTLKKDGTVSNLYLPADTTITIDSNGLDEDAKIYVTLQSGTGVFTTANDTSYANQFYSDVDSYAVIYNSSKCLEVVDPATVTIKDQNGKTLSTITVGKGQNFTLPSELKTGYSIVEYSYVIGTEYTADAGDEITIPDSGLEITAKLALVITDPTEANPEVSTEAKNVSYQWYEKGDSDKKLTNETSAKLANPVAHSTYFCRATDEDGITADSACVTFNAHAWSYALSNDKKTITASCQGGSGCGYSGADTSLTITAPTALEYDGTAKNANFGQAATFLGGTLPTITYGYKATKDGEYAAVTDTKKVGYYKASFTVGDKTGLIEYEVTAKQLTVTNTVVADKEYDGTVNGSATLGTVNGIAEGDDVTVKVESATFDNATAGTSKSVTVVYSISGSDASNYVKPANETTTADIGKKQLTVTGTVADGKDYDGNTAAVAYLGTVSGIVEGEDVTVEIDSADFANKNTENGKDVTVSYKISGTDASNYVKPANDTTIADINKKQLTVANTVVNTKDYDGTVNGSATLGTINGIAEGDDITVEIESVTYDDASAATDKNVTVSYKISGTDASNYVKPANDTTTADINKKQLNVANTVVNTKDYDGATTGSAVLGTVNGIAEGDDVTVKVESVTFDNATAGTSKSVTVSYKISGSDASNYVKPADDTTTADINKKQLTVANTVVNTKDYDGTVNGSATLGTINGLVEGDDVTVKVESVAFDSVNVGSNIDVTVVYAVTGNDASNYVKPANEILKGKIVPALIHEEQSDDVDVESDSGKGYKEFTIGQASASTAHIGGLTLDEVHKDSETGKYTGILVQNGETVLTEGTDYIVSEGSVKVELTDSYLNTFAVGNYTIKIYINKDGVATAESNGHYYEGTINVKVNPAKVVAATGEMAIAKVATGLCLFSLAGLGIALVLKKKKEQH